MIDAKRYKDGQHDATELLRKFIEEFFKNNDQEKYVITKTQDQRGNSQNGIKESCFALEKHNGM